MGTSASTCATPPPSSPKLHHDQHKHKHQQQQQQQTAAQSPRAQVRGSGRSSASLCLSATTTTAAAGSAVDGGVNKGGYLQVTLSGSAALVREQFSEDDIFYTAGE